MRRRSAATGMVLAGVLAVGLTGCATAPRPLVTVTVTSGASAAAAVATPRTPTVTPAAAIVAAVTPPKDATAVGKRVAKAVPTITKVVRVTEDNDPNDLLGRSNGYTSAAILKDSRVHCSEGLGADCGATIEGWPTAGDAKARRDSIVRILKGAPILGSEYDTVQGRYLLRVTGDLKPSQARRYAHAFAEAFGS